MVTTGELDLTDTFSAVKPMSSKAAQKRTADSTRAPAGSVCFERAQLALQGAAVDSHPDHGAPGGGGRNHLAHAVHPADVARVDAHGRRPRLQRRDGQPVVEVHVGDQGDRRTGHEIAEDRRGRLRRARPP